MKKMTASFFVLAFWGSEEAMKIPLSAWYFHSTIDLKKIARVFEGHWDVATDPLLLTFEEGKKICITSFGGVVFWPFDKPLADKVSAKLRPLIQKAVLVDEVTDRLFVQTQKEHSRVLFNEVWLKNEPTDDHIRIISNLLAQSVALEYRELDVDGAMNELEKYITRLRDFGTVGISSKKIIKSIGFSMHTRHAVLNSLSLWDKPEITWESEELANLYADLYVFFELDHRLKTMGRKLDFLKDNTSIMFDFLSTRKGLALEWTIVLLITLEIVMFVLYEAFRTG